MAKRTVIHVNQAVIRANHKTGAREPVLTAKTYDENKYGHLVIIRDKHGDEVARVVYNPDEPLSCGARVWIEVEGDRGTVEVIARSADAPATPSALPSCTPSPKGRPRRGRGTPVELG